jgi:hypothetical protein
MHRGISLALGLASVVTVACGPASERTPMAAARPNVIVIMVDTLRADHMSTYGYSRPTTPFIDGLAAKSVVFERARSQAACTFPSVNSFLTSRYAFDFYRQGAGEMGIPDAYPALAEMLAAAGYTTAAVSASPIVRATASDENPNGGFGRGFETFDETCLWDTAECVNRVVVPLLERLEEPFFLYLHYLDPHGHYAPPESYQKHFAGPYDGYDFIAAGDHNPIADMLYAEGPEIEITDRDMQHLVDLYDDEIRYFDGQLQSLVTPWLESGLLDRSLFIVTSEIEAVVLAGESASVVLRRHIGRVRLHVVGVEQEGFLDAFEFGKDLCVEAAAVEPRAALHKGVESTIETAARVVIRRGGANDRARGHRDRRIAARLENALDGRNALGQTHVVPALVDENSRVA